MRKNLKRFQIYEQYFVCYNNFEIIFTFVLLHFVDVIRTSIPDRIRNRYVGSTASFLLTMIGRANKSTTCFIRLSLPQQTRQIMELSYVMCVISHMVDYRCAKCKVVKR